MFKEKSANLNKESEREIQHLNKIIERLKTNSKQDTE